MTEWWAHQSAVVEDGADVGRGSRVWHHAHVRAGAVVGEECNLGKNVYVDDGAVVGDRVKIQNNVSVYRGVEVGNDVFLGPSCVFTNDRYPRASNPDWTPVPTIVADGASIGANATLVCGNRIGAWAVVAAGSVVTHAVLDHQLVIGNPARGAGWVARCGHVVSRASERPAELTCGECEGVG